MRQPALTMLFLTVAACWLQGCDGNQPASPGPDANTVVHIELSPAWGYFDTASGGVVAMDNYWITVSVLGSPMPLIQRLRLDTTACEDITDAFPFMFAGEGVYQYQAPRLSLTGRRNVTVQMDLGVVSGSVEVPRPARILSPADGDTLAGQDSVLVRWQPTADQYQLGLIVFDTTGDVHDSTVSTVDTQYVLTLAPWPAADGFAIYLNPVNGVLPVAGARPNMAGDGVGYLWCWAAPDTTVTSAVMVYVRQ